MCNSLLIISLNHLTPCLLVYFSLSFDHVTARFHFVIPPLPPPFIILWRYPTILLSVSLRVEVYLLLSLIYPVYPYSLFYILLQFELHHISPIYYRVQNNQHVPFSSAFLLTTLYSFPILSAEFCAAPESTLILASKGLIVCKQTCKQEDKFLLLILYEQLLSKSGCRLSPPGILVRAMTLR